MSETLLSIKNLKTYFVTDEAVLKAVDDVSFDVKEGETLEQTEGITLQPMNLQKVFVALCDGEDG